MRGDALAGHEAGESAAVRPSPSHVARTAGRAEGITSGRLGVDVSTMDPATSRQLAARLGERGVRSSTRMSRAESAGGRGRDAGDHARGSVAVDPGAHEDARA
jgi:hypothetical protein